MTARGFSLIEQLVALALVGVVLVATLRFADALFRNSQQGTHVEELAQLQGGLVSAIENDSAWAQTIAHNGSTFTCLTSGTCTQATPATAFTLFDAGGTQLSNSTGASDGMTLDGVPCQGFVASGNAACPIHLALTWRPICPSATQSCAMPAIEVIGQFQLTGANFFHASLNLQHVNFQMTRNPLNCDSQTVDLSSGANWNLSGVNANVTGPPSTVTIQSTDPATYSIANSAVNTVNIGACHHQSFVFQQKIQIAPGSFVTDADNAASVCVTGPGIGDACQFEWRQTGPSWALWRTDSGGTTSKVYVQQAQQPLDVFAVFEFRLEKGLVKFAINGVVTYIFDRPQYADFHFRVVPPPSNYSNGIAILSF